MVHYNEETKELAAKIVYYGPACSGKTSNLHYIHKKLTPARKDELITLKTDTDRTLYFDILTIRMGKYRDVKLRFLLYSVPGQVFYNEARKLVLEATDALVFVADSQRSRFTENVDCFLSMEQNVSSSDLSYENMPLVFQFNKRDLEDKVSVSELNQHLNKKSYSYFEAVALEGGGVIETFREISKQVLNNINTTHGFAFIQHKKQSVFDS